MNNELLAKAKSLVKEVLLNPKGQTDWIKGMDPAVLNLFSTFGKRFIKGDPNTSKLDAFKLGVMLGALYERSQEKDKIEKGGGL